MFHLFVNGLLIADLLVCPLFCTFGGICSLRCSHCESQQVQPQDADTESDAPPSCCCDHQSSAENSVSSSEKPNPAPYRAPEPCPHDCICKGALCDRPVALDQVFLATWIAELPMPFVTSSSNNEVHFYSAWFPAMESGRAVRTLYMSLLC